MKIVEGLASFVYLWTRDAELPANQDTEDYIVGQLNAIDQNEGETVFCDMARAEMAIRIIKQVMFKISR